MLQFMEGNPKKSLAHCTQCEGANFVALVCMIELTVCIIQFKSGSTMTYGEVLFYFQLKANNGNYKTLALVSQYSPLDRTLLEASSGTVWACHAGGDNSLMVINIKDILVCSAMIPFTHPDSDVSEMNKLYFAMDKLGTDIDILDAPRAVDSEDLDTVPGQ